MNWHAWSILNNKQRKVMEFLSELNLVDDFLCPMAIRELKTKSATKTVAAPVYSNYIFICYTHDKNSEADLKKCPWIAKYVGPCSDSEIEVIKSLNNKKYDELIPAKELKEGMVVKMAKAPFNGWDATIIDIIGDKLFVSLYVFGAERIIKCGVDDVETQK